ncbi:MAG: hypothetical protein VXZ96_01575 [Myxococcota bacterium]|nr:hypothetical protein [Myxococcota bacterium]
MNKKHTAVFWLPPTVAALIALIYRLYCYDNLDLAPMYGPGGVKSVTALIENYPQRDWATWLIASFLPFFGNDIELAARGTALLGSCLSVFGLSLSAQPLAGRDASWTVGLCAAFYAPLVWTGLLVGADSSGTGLVWLGLGFLFVIGTKYRFWWFIPVAMSLIILGAKVKITAFPAAAFLAIPPILLLSIKGLWTSTLYTAFLLISLYCGLLYIPDSNAHVGETPDVTIAGVQQGWASLKTLFRSYDVLPQLGTAAFVAAILPGRNWLGRLAILGLTIGVSAYIASVVGAKLRPRYLIPSTLTLLLLVGSLPHLWKWPRNLKHIPKCASVGLVLMLILDSLAFNQAWSELMHDRDGSQKASFPNVPSGWKLRYQKLSGLLHSDHSAIGIRIQHTLATDHPHAASLGVPLRDGREFHLRASAGLVGKKYRILEPQYCCDNTSVNSCAAETISILKQSGGRLILPIVTKYHNRIPHQSAAFTNALIRSAKKEEGWTLVEPWWGYLEFEGDGSTELPCPRPIRDGKGRKRGKEGSNQKK